MNLRWLKRVRWGGYLGLLVVVTSVQRLARLDFDQALAIAALTFGLLSNAFASPRVLRTNAESVAVLLLVIDTCVLTLLLSATGGPASPLVLGYAVLLVVASAVVSRKALWTLCALTTVALLLTAFVHVPLSADHIHGAGELDHHAGTLGHDRGGEHLWLHVRELWLATIVLLVLLVYIVRWAFNQRESELRVLRAEIEKNARLAELWTLAASAAHELGTPLSTISVVADELRQRARTRDWGSDAIDDLDVICEQLERCRGVLSNMANDARSRGREPNTEVSLSDFVSEACDATSAPHRVRVQLPDDAEQSRASLPRRLLLSVVQSLLDNALEASPPGATVHLEASSDTGTWSVKISDTGVGMNDAALERVGREPFSSKATGMGVGLFLGSTIVDRLGGSLQFLSDSSGTTVRLTVPRFAGTGPSQGSPA